MKKSAFISAISMGVMSISMAFADPAAVSQVRENATQILKILNKANGSNDAQIRREAENYITPYFDFDRMTALAVGQPWRQASPAQKKRVGRRLQSADSLFLHRQHGKIPQRQCESGRQNHRQSQWRCIG